MRRRLAGRAAVSAPSEARVKGMRLKLKERTRLKTTSDVRTVVTTVWSKQLSLVGITAELCSAVRCQRAKHRLGRNRALGA